MVKAQLSNNYPTIHSSTTDNIMIAAKMLQNGDIIAFPTETVYGLGAAAHDELAVQKIYAAKGRPSNNPLIIHVDSLEMAMQYGVFNKRATALAMQFFPAALTLVVPLIAGKVAKSALAGGQTVAIRCPAHNVARALITSAGFAIAAPSANMSGQISPTTAQHVATEFAKLPLFILEGDDAEGDNVKGGACEIGLESTVVDCTSPKLRILRHGSITAEQLGIIDDVASMQISSNMSSTIQSTIRSPGQLASHYAPKSRLRINAVAPNANELYLGFGDYYSTNHPANLNLSKIGDLTGAAHNLYAHLRILDEIAQSYAETSNLIIPGIACAPIPFVGVGIAINDRLMRAAFGE